MSRSRAEPPSTASRQAILAMAGDDAALADLVVRCRETMLVRAARLAPGFGPAELEDVVGESLLAAIRMRRSGRWRPEQGSFLGWLDRVVRNDLIDAARSGARAAAPTDPSELDALGRRGGHGPATAAIAGEQERLAVAAVRRALAAINPRYADVLLLRAVLGLDVGKVQKELGMTRRQVVDAAYEGRRSLFARLPRGERDWDVFVQHVEQRVALDSPAAVRALRQPPPS